MLFHSISCSFIKIDLLMQNSQNNFFFFSGAGLYFSYTDNSTEEQGDLSLLSQMTFYRHMSKTYRNIKSQS